MKTKEEIAANGNDEITIGDCFFGKPASEEDMRSYHDICSDIRDVINNEPSITMRTKRIFEEILVMQFNELQWLKLVVAISMHMDAAECRGAKKIVDVLELGMR
ncbi:hypothetical protein KAX02_03530 [candidate division WOR-3 bacterium]|nr:hypothetical protein [candidate division WOR-3 bacterium]